MDIKHIYWFAYFNLDEPSVRYRAKFPLEQLERRHHITYSIVYPAYDVLSILHFICIFFSALLFRRKNSLIVFQKIYSKGIYASALKVLLYFRPQHTLYDIDDAEHTRRPAETIHYFLKRCSACSAGSRALVDYIQPHNPNVFLLTSPVIDHGLLKQDVGKTLTMGWIGYYAAHRESLIQLLFPALLAIDFPLNLLLLGVADAKEAKEIQACLQGNSHLSLSMPLDLDWHNEESIYQLIRTFDIGVSPLLDTEFNRAKSAFKLKQCLSCGVPVLGSGVGENNVFLYDGVNGFVCETPADYYQKLTAIHEARNGYYTTLSQNARSSFPTFSIDSFCATFLNYYKMH